MAEEIFVLLFMELFCSLHMTFFVLKPIAEIKHPTESKQYLKKYFLLRAVILLIGNFITPSIAAIDFFMIFIGAFAIVPINRAKYRKQNTSDSITTVQGNASELVETTQNGQQTQTILTDIPELSEIFPDYIEDYEELQS